jgi:ABC-type uncharacterized transport system involved in gliding motility auxiliary subunit
MMGKKWSGLWWVGLTAALVAINFIAASFHFRIDLTEEKRYSLTNTTSALLKEADEELGIDVFLSGGIPGRF